MLYKDNIPVIMYHTVGRVIPKWHWSYLTVPFKIFEDHLKWLTKSGYDTVDLEDLYCHVSGDSIITRPSVVLTFDDGYVDNWTYVTPLLKKYGCKATVFVNPDFIDPRNIIRPTLDDVWAGKVKEEDLDTRGFISWQEIRQMVKSGVFSVQSHLMTHTWYPINDEVVDFHHPGDDNYWLDWNSYPQDKPYYLNDPHSSKVLYGTPIYKHTKSMEASRFYPDEEETIYLTRYVESNGGTTFFSQGNWREILFSVLYKYRDSSRAEGRYETQAERMERYTYELMQSKKLIEDNTKTEVNFLAWPGGGYDAKAMNLALNVYKSVTISSQDRSVLFNKPYGDPSKIRRLGVPNIEYNNKFKYTAGRYFVNFLDEQRNVRLARKRRQLFKLAYIFSLAFGVSKADYSLV